MSQESSPEIVAAAQASIALIDAEIAEAVAICVAGGFGPPPGAEKVGSDAVARLRWNYAYADAVRTWIEADPDWLTIGVGPRLAMELISAGVSIQIAADAIVDMPLAAAVALHSYSAAYGTWRSELRRWQRGEYEGRARENFVEAHETVAPMEAAGKAAVGTPTEAFNAFSQKGGQASGDARRWWWEIAWPRWKERREREPDEAKKGLAALLMTEMERAFPGGVGPKKGQRLPRDLGGYLKVVAKFDAGWTPAGKA